MGRVGLIAVWVVAGSATAGLIWLSLDLARRPAEARPEPRQTAGIQQADDSLWARWTVTEQLSAHHVLIVHVETRYLDEALAIARQVADPVKSRYAEVMVYFHRPGRPDTLPPRRVQWTPDGGWVETVYD